jgi:hypothetical protein
VELQTRESDAASVVDQQIKVFVNQRDGCRNRPSERTRTILRGEAQTALARSAAQIKSRKGDDTTKDAKSQAPEQARGGEAYLAKHASNFQFSTAPTSSIFA